VTVVKSADTGSTGRKVKSLIEIHKDEIVDSDGIPVPPKSMVELANRPYKHDWTEAWKKEWKGLNDYECFINGITLQRLKDMGVLQRVVHRLGGCVDKGSEWILSVARHRDPLADPVGMLRRDRSRE